MLFSILTKFLSRKRKEERGRERDLKRFRAWERESEKEKERGVWNRKESERERKFERASLKENKSLKENYSLKQKEVERKKEKNTPRKELFLASRGRLEGGCLPSQGRVSHGHIAHVSPAWSLRLTPQKAGTLLLKRPPPLLLSFTAGVHNVLTPPSQVSITWECFRNANSPAAQTHWIRPWGGELSRLSLTSPSGDWNPLISKRGCTLGSSEEFKTIPLGSPLSYYDVVTLERALGSRSLNSSAEALLWRTGD